VTRVTCFEVRHVTTNPAFCTGSRLASSSGDRIYAPGFFLVSFESILGLSVSVTFANSYNISEWDAGVEFDFLQRVVITL
jgi:hypothetical protein